ncbi:hypothetical protein L6164_031546 [Bauhinia variegata]|uniref:Uncharacterized protein n=1 Tax=Bauhinia variegata TaxID=167791 RepID=A0ACB9LFR6_BAUVA|nr:hypothetical protein L6164_031546 [Bauhinia variegata]
MKMGFTIALEAFSFLFLFVLVTKAKAADFNVKQYGEKADGISDDTGAIVSACREACTSMAPSTLIIPSGKYVAGEVSFQGPCKASSVTINLLGTLDAPIDPREFKSQGSWVLFQNIDGLTVWGGGILDGQGSVA